MTVLEDQHPKRNTNRDKYGTICVVCNLLMVLLMTTVTVVIQVLFGVPLLVIIADSIVLLFLFAWIEEHYISRLVNTLVEKAVKKDVT